MIGWMITFFYHQNADGWPAADISEFAGRIAGQLYSRHADDAAVAALLADAGSVDEWKVRVKGSGSQVIVAEHRGRKVGVVCVSLEDSDEGEVARISHLYVAADGFGIAEGLLERAELHAAAAWGATTVVTQLPTANDAARMFWARRGYLTIWYATPLGPLGLRDLRRRLVESL